jgi:hypothetical protein
LMSLLSDRFRFLKLSGAVALLGMMCLYSYIEGPRRHPPMERIVVSPARYEGQEMFRQVSVVGRVDSSGFTFKDRGRFYYARVTEESGCPPVKAGDFISFRALLKGGEPLVTAVHVHARRRSKIYISLAAFIAVLAYLGFEVRLSRSPGGRESRA